MKKRKKLLSALLAATLAISGTSITVSCSDVSAGEGDEKEMFSLISFEEGESYENYSGAEEVTLMKVMDEGVTEGEYAMKATYAPSNWPGFHLYAPEGKTWDFGEKCLSFDVYNPMDRAVQLCIKYDCSLESDVGTDAVYIATIKAGEQIKINTATGVDSVNLGMLENPQSSAGVSANYGWGNGTVDYTNIKHITFWLNGNAEETVLYFDNICLVDNPNRDYESAYSELVDKYGQYTRNTSAVKITKDEDFAAKKADEDEKLKVMQIETDNRSLSDYYGLKNETLKQEATGHFYVKKIDKKWFIIDPQGYPYYSTGIDIIRTEDANTWISGREFMFESLPDEDGDLGEHYSTVADCAKSPFDQVSGKAFNFYTANLERKYGDDWKTEWKNNAINRFKAWGFSSIGCWSDPDLFYGNGSEIEFPYVAHAWINQNHTKIQHASGTISDPFDPAFEEYAKAQMQKLKDQGINDDSYCMGLYVDNEIAWGNGSIAEQKYDVVKAVMKMNAADENSYAKKACIEKIKSTYSNDIAKLNEAWGTNIGEWEEIEDSYEGTMADSDYSNCLSLIADKYYQTIANAVKTYLPNIMYIGSRLAEWGTGTEIVQACAKYADIVSFNCYKTDVNQDFFEYGTYDKPIIIGEFHFTASDRNNFTAGLVPAANQEQRGQMYKDYMTSAYENPQVVGAHWFQYYDQPILGRAWDGENSNCGFVDVTDQPYDELVAAAKEINEKAYDIRLSYVGAESVVLDKSEVSLSAENSTTELSAQIAPENASNKDIVWTSSNVAVAAVDENGKVTALKNGEAEISASIKENEKLTAVCKVKVTGFVNTEVITFPATSFEENEEEVYCKTTGKDMELIPTTEEGVTDGKYALKVKINQLEKDPNKWSFSLLQSYNDAGWNIGIDSVLKFDVTNTNEFPVQLRVNIMDDTEAIRTYYFGLDPDTTRNLEISNFDPSADNWDGDGYFGANDGLNTKKIKSINFYLYENSDSIGGDILSAEYVIDNIRFEYKE